MQLKHCKSQLVEKKQELKQTEKEYQKDKQILDTVERELEGLEVIIFNFILNSRHK